MSLKNAARKTSRGWKTPPMWIRVNQLPVLEAATWVDVIVSSIKQSRKDCNFENLVNGVWKRHLPRK